MLSYILKKFTVLGIYLVRIRAGKN